MRQIPRITAWPTAATGLGLLMWSGMTTALLHLRPDGASTLHQLQMLGLLAGLLLLVAGLVAQRFAQPRLPRWTSRARMLALATLVIATLLWALLAAGAWRGTGPVLVAMGLLLLLAAFGTVAAVANGLATPEAPASWRHPMVLPVQLLFAMGTGLALLYVLMDRLFVSGNDGRVMLATLTGLGACIALCKGVHWRGTRDARLETIPSPRPLRAALLLLVAGGPLLGWLLAITTSVPVWMTLLLALVAMLLASVLEQRLILGENTPPAHDAGS